MNDTNVLGTIIAIALAGILMFVFPLMTIADRNDDIAQQAVQKKTVEFVDCGRKGRYCFDDTVTYSELNNNIIYIDYFRTYRHSSINDFIYNIN